VLHQRATLYFSHLQSWCDCVISRWFPATLLKISSLIAIAYTTWDLHLWGNHPRSLCDFQVLLPPNSDPNGTIARLRYSLAGALSNADVVDRTCVEGVERAITVAWLNIEPLVPIVCGGNSQDRSANSRCFVHQILAQVLQYLARLRYGV
jgi:hypothetical protein